MKGVAGAVLAAGAVLLAVVAFSGADRVEVHEVEKPPEDIREVWTPERVEDAKRGNPMPEVTQD
ncbi:hypothetical protein ACIBCR_27820 [Micromonospora echinospora]|uniref:hypothetical protein n=1 Tax=Micromonospora echinospora TaxID=1877 RepID=UPI0037996DCF